MSQRCGRSIGTISPVRRPDLVHAARQEELKVVDELGLWEIRPIAECIEVTGKKPVKVRWVDVNKGDDKTPNVRCRIVAKDFNIDKRPDLFAATPPLEFLRYLVSRCASSQLSTRKTKLMVQDVKRHTSMPRRHEMSMSTCPLSERNRACAPSCTNRCTELGMLL